MELIAEAADRRQASHGLMLMQIVAAATADGKAFGELRREFMKVIDG